MVGAAVALAMPAHVVFAGAGSLVDGLKHHVSGIADLFHLGAVNVKSYECNDCSNDWAKAHRCIKRTPHIQCVEGKKRCEECVIKYEYVAIPEVRYRWRKMLIPKAIPVDGYVPVCKSQETTHCYGQKQWKKQDGLVPPEQAGCQQSCPAEIHCRSVEPKLEKAECKSCDYKPGKTVIKVRFLACVKEPYTVYRQVKRPVCVRHARYVDTKVRVKTYECEKLECSSPCQSGSCGASSHCCP